ncbi:MAG: phosphoglycerate kinase [Candidatus Cloacimonetes bacterium]|nr:phosphoglycerate kinase [Candidatus Cloacimonadota bacterium]
MAAKTIPLFSDADLKGKIVLVRMDHNVVKKGKIKDTMRIDASLPTLREIINAGGLPVVMTHVGRPYDKKTGLITISDDESVAPIVTYLDAQLGLKGLIPELPASEEHGIVDLDPLAAAITKLKNAEVDYLYLPNTRWFKGEEAKDASADVFAKALASYADLYVNDAFGSWQAHASTYNITRYLPSYAGLLMLKEIDSLRQVFDPQRPLVAVVAGAKFDTKIGPLSSLIKICDQLVLGGVIYNAYLAHKYGLKIKGVADEDVAMAAKFVSEAGAYASRIVELPVILESDSIEARQEGAYRALPLKDLKPGTELNYILDAAPQSFEDPAIKGVFINASTIFVNAVMGYTALFGEGTAAMYSLIDQNPGAQKLFGGGDTIQDYKALLPELFSKAARDPHYYFFTGGGAILDAIEQGSPYGMKPVAALISNK